MDQDRKSAVRIVVGLVVAIVVLILLTWLIFFRNTGDDGKNAKETSKTTASRSSKDTDNHKTDRPPAVQGSQTGDRPAASQQLAEAGPGNVIAIFIGTSALAAAGHYVLRRRASSQPS